MWCYNQKSFTTTLVAMTNIQNEATYLLFEDLWHNIVPEFAYPELLSFIKAQNIWMKWARDVAGRQSLSLATVHCPEKKGTSANVAISN